MTTVLDEGTPLLVTAHLDTESIGLDAHPVMLDGPLAWAHVMDAKSRGEQLPPITGAFAPDFPLPLARWGVDGAWGWCSSRATFTVEAHTTVNIRRKPATQAMARYSSAGKHHLGLGPAKARDTALAAAWITSLRWHVLCTDRQRLAHLLGLVTHLGERHRNGFGHVTSWTIEESHQAEAWLDRPLPRAGGVPMGIRAPYWHHSRRAAC